MKQNRHDRILELINEHEIRTQEELLDWLRKSGFNVTQATVSRDIKSLRLVKTLSGSGEYVYTTNKVDVTNISAKFDTLLSESAIKIDFVLNQLLIKCYTGLANAVCAAMDGIQFDGLVGTISGDDTILVIMRTEEDARNLCMKLRKKLP